jgi:hypothetical protein
MTVEQLIKELTAMPMDSEVFYPEADYNQSYARVETVGQLPVGFGRYAGVYLNPERGT